MRRAWLDHGAPEHDPWIERHRNPPGEIAIRGVNLLNDPCFELPGVVFWPAGIGASSKSTDSPYVGAQVLRVTKTSGSSAYAVQVVMVAGQTYRFTAQARGNAASRPQAFSGGVRFFNGTSSTAWQEVDETFIASAGDLRLYANGGVATDWVDFDCAYLELVPA